MKTILAYIAILALPSIVWSNENTLRDSLTGNWVLEMKGRGGSVFRGYTVYSSDGTVAQSGKVMIGEKEMWFSNLSSWWVKEDTVFQKVIYSTDPNLYEGKESSAKVNSISTSEIVYTMTDGRVVKELRVSKIPGEFLLRIKELIDKANKSGDSIPSKAAPSSP